MAPKKKVQDTPPAHDEIVILRGPREGNNNIWRSSNGFVDVSKHQHLAFQKSEVYVKRRENDLQVGWDIVGPVNRGNDD